MTKFLNILSISIAICALMATGNRDLVASESSETLNKKTGKNLSKKKSKKPKKKNKASCQKENKTPLWLKIEHTPLVYPKETKKKMATDHPFNKALAAAYNYNPQIKSKLRQYYATTEGVSQAMAGFRPSITGQAQTGYSVTADQNREPILDNVIGAQSVNPKSATLNITQNLYKGGGTVAGMSSAENQVRSMRADFLNTAQSTLLSAAQAYLDLWQQREKLKTIKISEQFYKESLEQVKAQAEVGESSTITDVAQAEFSYEKSVATRIATEADLENAHAAYIQVMGEEPPAVLILPLPIQEMMQLPSALPVLLEAVGKYNPGIIKAEYDHAAAKDSIDVAAAALLPSVDLVGSADRQLSASPSTRNLRQNDASVFLRLTVPFYNNGGTDWSAVRQSEQTALQKRHDLKAAQDAFIQNAKQTWKNLSSNKSQIKRYEAAIKAGDVRTEGTRQEFIVGERSLLEVLQAEADVVDARVSLLQERHDYILNGYRIVAAIGELTPEVLQLAVASYDLNAYPQTVRDQWMGWDKPAPLQKREREE